MMKKVSVFYICLLITIMIIARQDLYISPDITFLYNRVCQMYDVLTDGNYPFFYYNDFYGVGYGTAFFYGDLTLYPFVWTAMFDIKLFVKLFITSFIILNYLGARFFAKRFTENYEFVAFVYIACAYTLEQYFVQSTFANFYAIGISFFFLGFCVDFFVGGGQSIFLHQQSSF